MSRSLYELVALGARYVFAGLMALIVLRAWRITLIDSRRAAALRRMSPQTGLSGELVVIAGDGKARRGMKYPVIREGMIGSARRADIRIRHASIRRMHAWFQLTGDGLRVQARTGAAMRDAGGRPVRAITLADGGEFTLGQVRLLLVLAAAPEPAEFSRPERHEHRERHERREAPAGPADDPDDLFRAQPVLQHMDAHGRHAGAPGDDLFDTEDD